MTIELLPGVSELVSIPLDKLMTLWDAGFPGAEGLNDKRPLNATHVRLLSESHGHWPPITLCHFRDNEHIISNYQPLDAYAVVDGRHRWEAAKRLKYKSIMANVRAYKTVHDVMNHAFLANRNHGTPSTNFLRMQHAVWLHEYYGDVETLENIASIAGVTVRALKGNIGKEEVEEEKEELTPINSFAFQLYKSINELRKSSEQNQLFRNDGIDDKQVINFISIMVKSLPVGERGDMRDFIDTVASILDKVRK